MKEMKGNEGKGNRREVKKKEGNLKGNEGVVVPGGFGSSVGSFALPRFSTRT